MGGLEVGVRLEHNSVETTQEGGGHHCIPPREGDGLRQGMPHVGGVWGLVPQGGVAQLRKGGGVWWPARHSICPRHWVGVELPRPMRSLDIAPPCLDRGKALLAVSAGRRSLYGGNSPWQGQQCGPCARACARSTIWQILAIAAVVIYFTG